MSFLNITGYKRLTIFIWLTGILVTTNIELAANQPKWIWNSKDAKDGEKAFFRKQILSPKHFENTLSNKSMLYKKYKYID